jgi:hypothetical protein
MILRAIVEPIEATLTVGIQNPNNLPKISDG